MDENYFINKLDKEFNQHRSLQDNGFYFTESDYQELQRNLILYKEGNGEATTYIVKTFHQFITKYARFIKNGEIPYYTITNKKSGAEIKKVSPTISMFISLYIDKSESEDKKKLFSNTCLKIKSLFSKYEYCDIYNELVLALLNMANKYKIITDKTDPHYKKNGTFHMYVQKCFHWEAFKYLKSLVRDPLSHFDVLQLCDQFDDMDLENSNTQCFVKDEKATIMFEEMIETSSRQNDIQHAEQNNSITLKEDKNISAYDIEALNFNWTYGTTCSELFKCLSSYEREIIILSYIKHMSEEEIAKRYGCCRASINKHKRAAVQKIEEQAKRLNILNI